jgi:hypothetical protein
MQFKEEGRRMKDDEGNGKRPRSCRKQERVYSGDPVFLLSPASRLLALALAKFHISE